MSQCSHPLRDIKCNNGSSKNVHLLVLIHGLWGSPRHLGVARQEVERVHADHVQTRPDASSLHVMVPTANSGTLTYDGMDVCAARILIEVKREVSKLEGAGIVVREFSVMGYSLGGLVARYLVGLLQASGSGFFERHRPVSFSTLATPHLGILRYKNRFWQWVAVKYGHCLLGRSGDQLYYKDRFDDHEDELDEHGRQRDRRPLLEVMADPNGVFVRAMNRFESISIFANAVQDSTVPYPTGAIDRDDHFVYDPSTKRHDDVVIETDSDHLITRWYSVAREQEPDIAPPTYRELYDVEKNLPIRLPLDVDEDRFVVRIEPAERTQSQTPWRSPYLPPRDEAHIKGYSPRCASFRLDDRQFIVSIMRIVLANKTKRVAPSILPPFLRFRRPYNWLFYASVPVLTPVFMILVVIVFHRDSFTSRRRVRLLGQVRSALVHGLSTATHSSALGVLAVAELTRLISSAQDKVSSDGGDGAGLMSSAARAVGMDDLEAMSDSAENDSEMVRGESHVGSCLSSPPSQSSDCASSISRVDLALETSSTSSTNSRRNDDLVTCWRYPDLVDGSPPAPPRRDPKLCMTSVQHRVAEMLNRGLDPRRTTRFLTWFPNVPNAHAAITVRDGPLFPEQEIGRGILRRWAGLTVVSS